MPTDPQVIAQTQFEALSDLCSHLFKTETELPDDLTEQVAAALESYQEYLYEPKDRMHNCIACAGKVWNIIRVFDNPSQLEVHYCDFCNRYSNDAEAHKHARYENKWARDLIDAMLSGD